VDGRADLYALGLLIDELARGSQPYGPVRTPLEGPSALLEPIVARCLKSDPAARFQSAFQVVASLEAVQNQLHQPGVLPRGATGPAHNDARDDARQWWEIHQAIVSGIYIALMYPAWRAHVWMRPPWGRVFLLAVLACATAATTLRLNLWFTARVSPNELDSQRKRAVWWIRAADAGITAALMFIAGAIVNDHPEVAMLLITVEIAGAVASFFIEPATARAAFRP